MWQMKFKFVVQSVWRRRKELYYAVSVVSIAGNLVVFVGPSLQSSIVLRSGALHAAWSVLPQVAELVLHRSMLYILLNLIVARIVVKSGVLGRTTPGVPAKVDDFGLPSSYYVVRGSPWAATNSYSVYETQAQLMPGVPMFTDPSMWLQQARVGEDQNSAAVDARPQTPAPKQPTIKKSRDNEQPKNAPAPSLFTIEPLDELVQITDSYTLKDDESHVDKTLKRPLRKVASRRADLYRSTQARAAGTTKDSRKAIELAQRSKDEQSMQLVLAKQEDGGGGAEHEDNRLSGQEFFERVDTYIIKVKKRLTMQRQESLNRLFGGGDIRLIK